MLHKCECMTLESKNTCLNIRTTQPYFAFSVLLKHDILLFYGKLKYVFFSKNKRYKKKNSRKDKDFFSQEPRMDKEDMCDPLIQPSLYVDELTCAGLPCML